MTNLNPFMTRLIRAGWIAPLVGVVLFAGLWEAVVRIFDVRPFVLLAPSEIGAELSATPGFFFENALVPKEIEMQTANGTWRGSVTKVVAESYDDNRSECGTAVTLANGESYKIDETTLYLRAILQPVK